MKRGPKPRTTGGYIVEKNVPIVGSYGISAQARYPEIYDAVSKLRVNDSIKYPIKEDKFFKAVAGSIRKKDEGFIVTHRKVDDEFGRVWRIGAAMRRPRSK